MKQRVYLSSPHMSGHEMKYVNEAFDQNWIAPLGPNVDGFERTLADYCNVVDVAAVSSGTAALHLAMILLGVKSGDEVMVSTFTFSATVNPIIYQRAEPVFIDSEPDTWNMDPDLLRIALEERKTNGSLLKVKAIVMVHLYGMPAKVAEILEVAQDYNIPVIEDAAEALGSKYNGIPLGSFGDFGVLSFNGNKIITTSGGGALLSNDTKVIEKARFLATQARDKAPHYQHSQIGYNYRMSNILAGVGRGQMEVLEEWVRKRRSNFSYYRSSLAKLPGISLLEQPSDTFFSNYWLTTILVDPKKSKTSCKAIREALEELNIESRPLWKPMHAQPVFEKYSSYLNGVSDNLFKHGLCLPSGSNLTDNQRSKVVEVICDCVKNGSATE